MIFEPVFLKRVGFHSIKKHLEGILSVQWLRTRHFHCKGPLLGELSHAGAAKKKKNQTQKHLEEEKVKGGGGGGAFHSKGQDQRQMKYAGQAAGDKGAMRVGLYSKIASSS